MNPPMQILQVRGLSGEMMRVELPMSDEGFDVALLLLKVWKKMLIDSRQSRSKAFTLWTQP